jgi:hypothetical protein
MSDPFGLIYAIVVCALGGMTSQYVYRFFFPKLGMIWSGGIAAMIGFLVMVAIAASTQLLFNYPALNGAEARLPAPASSALK